MKVDGRQTHPAETYAQHQQLLEVIARVAVWLALGACAGYGAWSLVAVTMRLGPADHGSVGTILFTVIWSGLAAGLVARIVALRMARSRAAPRELATVTSGGNPSGVPQPTGSERSTKERRWRELLIGALGLSAVLAVYHGVFGFGVITWGDWNYYLNAGAVRQMFPLPSFWVFADLGNQNILGLPLAPIEVLMGLAARMGLAYSLIERIFFYFPAISLSYLGCHLLLRRAGVRPLAAAIAGVFFAANPYAEQLFAGGQLTVGMGYALAPWSAWLALRLWRHPTWGRAVACGTVIGVQGWFDPREALLSLMAGAVVLVVLLLARPSLVRAKLTPWPVALGALALVTTQLPWILPGLLAVRPAFPSSYTTPSALQALSYMTLGDGLTIFHPFWPFFEHPARIAGVTVIWIVVPAVACLALLAWRTSLAVMGASAVYLLFAALTSGSNLPFGPINLWLFSHIPGLDVFRDPSPYFGPAALAVSVLGAMTMSIPWGRSPRDDLKSGHTSTFAVSQLGAAAIVLLPVLILVAGYPALSNRLGDNLRPGSVPGYYLALASFLRRTGGGSALWIPDTSRFALKSSANPSISAWNLEQLQGVGFPPGLGSPAQWLSQIQLAREVLQRYGIRYVVVRTDRAPYSTLSLSYSATRAAAMAAFRNLPHRAFGPLEVYLVPGAPAAPLSTVPGNKVLEGAPPSLQSSFQGYPLTISTPGPGARSDGAASLFPAMLSNAATRPGQSLSIAEPTTPFAVVEILADGPVLLGRTLPTVQSIFVGGRLVSAPLAAPWARLTRLGPGVAGRGIVVTVDGLNHYLSGPSLSSGKPAVVTVAPDPVGGAIPITVSTLGASLIPQGKSAGKFDGWGSLGNENNYNDLPSLAQAGISASGNGACGPGAVTLTAGEDAAGISVVPSSPATGTNVVTAEIRSVSGPPPILRVAGPSVGLTPVGVAQSNRAWTPVTYVADGGLSSLQLLLYASGHSRAVGCVRGAAILPVTETVQAEIPVARNLGLSSPQVGLAPGEVSYADAAAQNLQLLPTSTFEHGLGAWAPVGNGDNFNHASLRADGVSSSIVRNGASAAMALRVSIGAASVSQNFTPFAVSDEYRISITYRATRGAQLVADLYPQGADVPAVGLSFPVAGGVWTTEEMTTFSGALGPTQAAGFPVDILTILLWPGNNRTAQADISRVTLTQVVPVPQLIRLPSDGAALGTSAPLVTPKWHAGAGGDTFVVSAPSGSGARVLVLWQAYAPGWQATDSGGGALPHLLVNGWANGFVLSGQSAQGPIEVTFTPQRWEAVGLGILAFFLLLGAAVGLGLVARRWSKESRAY